ncbi:putative pilus assembly protein chaperone [Collimonas fungivorans Ter331]|uniref:Putative pilus assembly protein chaperone n=2 Tax=Collimonas fungivorans TaxID=158899 RepID=G0AC45_COLFT|nr:putative pilus assembly protein chaperone [Collimonas fungivorans Ter331]
MMLKLKRWPAVAFVLCMFFAQDINAASFNVNPIGFDLSAERASGVLQIRNTGDEPVRIQVGAVDWSTDGRQEVLADTDALLLNPPIFSIEPGQIQFLRFGVRHPMTSATEKSYRLLIDEVPPSGPQAPGLKTLLRISIPVFIAPKTKQEKISWQLKRESGGLVLVAANDGNVHAKIIHIQLNNALNNGDSGDGLQISTPAYVLPGQHKQWSLANGKIRAGAVRLQIQTDKGEIEEHLMLEADQVSSR